MSLHPEDYIKARKVVKRKRSFYRHLGVFIAVNLFLFLMNLATDNEPWFHFTTISWGMGLLIHYFSVFGLPFVRETSEEWESRQMDRELRRIEERSFYSEPLPKKREITPLPDELELKEFRELRKDFNDSEFV